MDVATNRHLALFFVSLISAVGSGISTLEWIYNRQQLAAGGLYDWQVVGSREIAVGKRWRARLINLTLSYRPYLVILGVRLIAVLALPAAIWVNNRAAILTSLTLVLLTTLLVNLRSIYGMDGSDQMTTQIHGALFLGYVSGTALGLTAALWYIALQSCLSYFTSGLAKALSPDWRKGACIFRIFNTRTYGYKPVARLLKDRPRLTRCLDWSAFLVEISFPLGIIVGFPAVLFFLAWGVGFHLMNAGVMGLNSFVWAFTATYPAIIFVALVVSR